MDLPDFKSGRDSNGSSSLYFLICGFYSRCVGSKKIIRPLLCQQRQRSWNWQAAQVHGKLFSPFLFFFFFGFSSFRLKAKLLRIPKDINVIIDVRKTTPQRGNFSEYFTIFCVSFARYTFAILSATTNSVLANWFRWPSNNKRAHVRACRHRVAIAINASTF